MPLFPVADMFLYAANQRQLSLNFRTILEFKKFYQKSECFSAYFCTITIWWLFPVDPYRSDNDHKKFELMLTKGAKAYSSSCSQIALVYLQPFRRSSLLKCAAQPKIAKEKQW